MSHLVNDSKSSVTSIKTSSSSILGVSGSGDGNVVGHKNATEMVTETLSKSTSDKNNTNFHKTDPSK